jgi:hypothetical protein
MAEAQRLRNEAEERATIAESARREAQAVHANAVVDLRAAVAAAFLAETIGEVEELRDALTELLVAARA